MPNRLKFVVEQWVLFMVRRQTWQARRFEIFESGHHFRIGTSDSNSNLKSSQINSAQIICSVLFSSAYSLMRGCLCAVNRCAPIVLYCKTINTEATRLLTETESLSKTGKKIETNNNWNCTGKKLRISLKFVTKLNHQNQFVLVETTACRSWTFSQTQCI